MSQRLLSPDLDTAAALFFLVAAGIVFVPAVPWIEFYQEQRVEGEDISLLVESFGGTRAVSSIAGGVLSILAAGLLFGKRSLAGFWVAVLAFFSGVFTYALLHTTLTSEIAPERKQVLLPGWGISTFLLWMGVGLFLFFIHRWGAAIWVKGKQALAPVEERLKPDELESPSRSTWVVALILIVLMVVLVVSADPDDKVWKRMVR